MPDPEKVRLVRCPKCEKLLPELEGYSVYECGGCGAVLRANTRESLLPQKSDEVLEENLYSNVVEENLNCQPKNDIFNKKCFNEGSYNDETSKGSSFRTEDKRNEKSKSKNWVVDDNLGRNETSYGYTSADMEQNLRKLRPSNGFTIGSQQSESINVWENKNQNFQALRYSTPIYSQDGPSSYASRHIYGHKERKDIQFSKVEHLEQDRAEILKKLDELKDQINRSCIINDKPKENYINNMNQPSYATQYNGASPCVNQHEPNPCFLGNYIHTKMDPYIQPYRNDEINLHHPHCTRVHCYNNYSRASPSFPPHQPYNPISNQHGNKSSFVPSTYNSYTRNFHPRVGVTSGKRCCRPIAGGAPVVSCYKCFQLLELPKTCSSTRTNLVKMKCGACSTLVVFEVVDKKLVPTSVDTSMILNMRVNQASLNFSSEDFDDLGYDFQFLDREGHDFDLHKFKNIRDFNSASSCSSKHEVSSSDIEDHFDYSSEYRYENGDRSEFSVREKAELRKITSLASEMDVSFNEEINADVSLESGDTSKDEDQLRVNKRAQSFFRGIINKGFKKDLSKSTSVIINGHYMSEKLLRKAEKIAGPVHPGRYWYDYRAGFWGVMGGPCLGIIPPFIEEFNHPMPENCAGGDTDVFLNGRELHRKDLNLLSCRGLPSTGDRSYVIEISGRVLDEDTGEELPSLGKLAPTVEKVKHGFGMKVPRIA